MTRRFFLRLVAATPLVALTAKFKARAKAAPVSFPRVTRIHDSVLLDREPAGRLTYGPNFPTTAKAGDVHIDYYVYGWDAGWVLLG